MRIKFCSECGEVTGDVLFCPECESPLLKSSFTPLNLNNNAQQNRSVVVNPKNSFIAAILSFFWPGLGQLYNGNFWKGLFFNICYYIGLFPFIIPGLIVWIYNMYDAYTDVEKCNKGKIPASDPSFMSIVIFLAITIATFLFACIVWLAFMA